MGSHKPPFTQRSSPWPRSRSAISLIKCGNVAIFAAFAANLWWQKHSCNWDCCRGGATPVSKLLGFARSQPCLPSKISFRKHHVRISWLPLPTLLPPLNSSSTSLANPSFSTPSEPSINQLEEGKKGRSGPCSPLLSSVFTLALRNWEKWLCPRHPVYYEWAQAGPMLLLLQQDVC